ncbi:hypothetical protein [Maribacter halichondriae]|nr:hypothetical protein [Maribacter sp. Hal144]
MNSKGLITFYSDDVLLNGKYSGLPGMDTRTAETKFEDVNNDQ